MKSQIKLPQILVQDIPETTNKSPNLGLTQNHQLPISILFIADCKSVTQLSYDLETMPGAGIANIEVFPLQETAEIQ